MCGALLSIVICCFVSLIQRNAGIVVFVLCCSLSLCYAFSANTAVVFVLFIFSWVVCLCGSDSIPEFSGRAGTPRYLS